MTKIAYIATALLLTSVSVAYAADTANQPVAQGATSVNKNLSKNPDNKGLQRAAEQLKENEEKIAEKRADVDKTSDDAKHTQDKEEKQEHVKGDKHERMEKADHDKIEHPEKAERPERMEQPEKNERPR